MKRAAGFTIIELLILIVVFGTIAGLVFVRSGNYQGITDDRIRKVAINAMYYNLEEVYYKQNSYYPSSISSSNLTAMDPDLFVDPNGVKLGDNDSNYRYSATDCDGDKCQSYTLRADLQKEADFVKSSRH